jgi:iron complex outermembrane receptor protein
MTRLLLRWLPAMCALAVPVAAGAAQAGSVQSESAAPQLSAMAGKSYEELSLEELMNVEVTSASKKPQRLADTTSAIFVITQDDIRRSGATSLPEVLRMAPGVEVARMGTDKWAVSVRGFSERFDNKLLVLIDGRSAYTPLFSGVMWNMQSTPLEDIERIEIIRGPGAALWGANAVNGVINIITKDSKDTQSNLVSAGSGNQERGFGYVRHGGKIGAETTYRIYGQVFDRAPGRYQDGREANDSWRSQQGGFRLDWRGGNDQVTVTGSALHTVSGDLVAMGTVTPPYQQLVANTQTDNENNLLARWQRKLGEASDLALQAYYDQSAIRYLNGAEQRQTIDIDFQHRLPLSARQDLVWGLGMRQSRDQIDSANWVALNPASRTTNLYSAFFQDDITLKPERWRLTLGSKFEHNDYTGYEVEPNARLLWTPDPVNRFWLAQSRAVRMPSRIDSDSTVNQAVLPPLSAQNPSPLPVFTQFQGSTAIQSERVDATELGYRAQLSPRLAVDVAAYHNHYTKLETTLPGTPQLGFCGPFPCYVVQPVIAGNQASGHSSGIELVIDWRARDNWRQQLSLSHLTVSIDNSLAEDVAGKSPRNIVSYRSQLDLPGNLQLDGWLRYVSGLEAGGVPAYTTLDLRLAWKPRKDVELSLVGQNLLQPHHLEFVSTEILSEPTEVQRSVYGAIRWEF